jgi:hypothetical protein
MKESKRQRHLASGEEDTARSSNGCRNPQRGARWGDGQGNSAAPNAGVPDGDGTKRSVHQPVRVLFENCLWALLPQAVPSCREWQDTHVSVELDNVTSIKCGKVAVSRSTRVSLLGARFFDKAEEAGTSLTFKHLAGEANVVADELSRRASSHADWQLNRQVFQQLRNRVVPRRGFIRKCTQHADSQLPQLQLRSPSARMRRVPAELVEPRSAFFAGLKLKRLWLWWCSTVAALARSVAEHSNRNVTDLDREKQKRGGFGKKSNCYYRIPV